MKKVSDTRKRWIAMHEATKTYDEMYTFHRKMYRILSNRLRVMRRGYVRCCESTSRWKDIVENMIVTMRWLSTKLNRERMAVSLLLDKLETAGINTEDLAKIIREVTEKAVPVATREDVLARRF